MKQPLPFKSLFAALMLFLVSMAVQAQFRITVDPIDARCANTGGLRFTVAEADPSAPVSYTYTNLLTGQSFTVTDPIVNNLAVGFYSVIATQRIVIAGIPTDVVTAAVTVEIELTTDPAVYGTTILGAGCGPNGSVQINVVQGTADTYQMISPTTGAQQSTGLFTGLLPNTTYLFRVVDDCGNSQDVTAFVPQAATSMNITGHVAFPNPIPRLPSCNTILRQHRITVRDITHRLFFPLSIEYVVTDPNGVVVTPSPVQVLATDPLNPFVTVPIPFFEGQRYTYVLRVTDACGNVFTSGVNVVDEAFELDPLETRADFSHCEEHLFITPINFVGGAPQGDFEIHFTSPPGFDAIASQYNAGHPFFTGSMADYGIDVPDGTYEFTVVDLGCPQNGVATGEIIKLKLPYAVSLTQVTPCVGPGTVSGVVSTPTPGTTDWVAAPVPPNPSGAVVIIASNPPLPAGYPLDRTPFDIDFQNAPQQFNTVLPQGDYTFQLRDECGNTYTESITVAPNTPGATLQDTQWPGCDVGFGSVEIYDAGNVYNVLSAEIVDGPAAWRANNPTLPVDVTAFIGPGPGIGLPDRLYVNGLPETLPGETYTFNITDICGTTQYVTELLGYHFVERTAVVNTTVPPGQAPDCNSFRVELNDIGGNNDGRAFYFLQKEITPGVWGHPETNVPYTPGNPVTSANAVNFGVLPYSGGVGGITTDIIPGTPTSFDTTGVSGSIAATGTFRVLQIFDVHGNGSYAIECENVMATFTYLGRPVLNNIVTAACATGSNEVIVDATGVGTLEYRITAPATAATPFQTSPVFAGLLPGSYTFEIQDRCGNLVAPATVGTGSALAVTQSGGCANQLLELDVPQYNFLTYEWFPAGSTDTTPLQTGGTLSIANYDPAANGTAFEVRITYPGNPASCLNQTIPFTVVPQAAPVAGADNTTSAAVCTGSVTSIDLSTYLAAGVDAGTFAQDATTPGGTLSGTLFDISTITTSGTYSFTYTAANACGTDDATIIVRLTESPVVTVNTLPTQCVGNNFTLTATSTTPGVTYTWTLPTGSGTNVTVTGNTVDVSAAQLTNGGTYSVVAQLGNCTSAPATSAVSVVNAPNAGVGRTVNICNTIAGTLENLETSTYLGATFDNGGVWTDASGNVISNNFDTAGLFGQFVFTYTVSACGTQSVTTVTLNLNVTPAAPVLTALTSPVCEGGTVQIDATPVAGTVVTYAWTLPNGTITITSVPQLVINSATVANHNGAYTLTVTADGCSVITPQVNVDVVPLPLAGNDGLLNTCSSASGSVTSLSSLLVGSFDTATTAGIASAVWTDVSAVPDSAAFNAANGTFDTAGVVPGTYTFTYTVTSVCGAVATANVVITIDATPAQPVLSAALTTVCEGSTIDITNTTPIAGATYSWTNDAGTVVSTEQDLALSGAEVSLAAAGDYTLTVTTAGGCFASSAPVTITVTALPLYSLGGNTVICPNQNTTISVLPANFGAADTNITYVWTLDGAPTAFNTREISINQPGNYEVVVSNNGCASPAQSVTVTLDTDAFVVVLESDCVDGRFIVRVANLDEIGTTQSISWAGPGLTATTGNDPQFDLTDYTEDSQYTATVTNADGCVKVGTIDVERTNCMIPKGISPNGDELNDEFDLTNLKVENLQIFNRYGLQVYEKANYTKEWFGQSDKGDLPTGTYFYVATMPTGQVTGWVYIQRESK